MSSFRTNRAVFAPTAPAEKSRESVGMYVWLIVWAMALATRIWAGFHLPNAEQDGYSDAETIARLSAALASGHFRVADLYGFWLPLFQLIAAVPNLWLDDPLLCGQMVSALCGAVSCVLVFAISYRMTRRILLSAAVFGLILLSPLHILYSAACMTDVPFGCLALASLWFLLRDQWFLAVACVALASAIRVEAWALIPLLPFLQYLRQRRVSFVSCVILLLPPLGWLYVGRVARGDWFAFFHDRVLYHAHYIEFHPSRSGFTLADVRGDLDYLMLGANWFVLLAAILTGLIIVMQFFRRRRISWDCLAAVSYLGAIIAFLVLAYITKRQPVWLPRYGLTIFVLGLPLLAWLSQLLMESSSPRWLGQIGVAAMLLTSASLARPQISIIPKVLNDFQAHRRVTDALVSDLRRHNDEQSHCFSDDIAVRVLSRLPPNRLHRSTDVPTEAWDSIAVFETYLRDNHVAYVVFMPTEDSLPVKFYPELGRTPGPAAGKFEQIATATSTFGPDVWLYRVRF
jgi:hypothetical protein